MKNDLFSLKNKVVVITGGSGFLGSEFVSQMLSQGAQVCIFDVDRRPLVPKGVSFYDCDITETFSVSQAIKRVIQRYGKIDVLVNNAYPRNKSWGAFFEKIKLADWNDNVEKHLGGYFNVTQQVSREMMKKRSGCIINIASIYGVVGPDFSIYEGTPMTMPAEYAAIKGGLVNFTRYLATYLGSYGIRVNAVSPGGVFNHQDKKFVKAYEKKVPLKRMAKPCDIAGTVVFLASEASGYITGQNIVVDGGWTAW